MSCLYTLVCLLSFSFGYARRCSIQLSFCKPELIPWFLRLSHFPFAAAFQLQSVAAHSANIDLIIDAARIGVYTTEHAALDAVLQGDVRWGGMGLMLSLSNLRVPCSTTHTCQPVLLSHMPLTPDKQCCYATVVSLPPTLATPPPNSPRGA